MNDGTGTPHFAAAGAGRAMRAGGPSPVLWRITAGLRAQGAACLAFGAVVALVTGGALLSAPQVFEARTILLVQLGRDQTYVPDMAPPGLRTPDPGEMAPFVNAEMQVLASDAVRQAALDQLLAEGVLKMGPQADRARLLQRLEDAVSLGLVTGSHMIDLRVRDGDPQRAQRIAASLTDSYLDLRGGMIGADPPEVLRDRLAVLRDRLVLLEARLSASGADGGPDQPRAASGGGEGAQGGPLPQEIRLAILRAEAEAAALGARVTALTRRVAALARPAAATAMQGGSPAATADAAARIGLLLAESEADLAAAAARLDRLRQGAALWNRADTAVPAPGAAAQAAEDRAALAVLRVERDALAQATGAVTAQLIAAETAQARAKAGFGAVRLIENGRVGGPVGLPDRVALILAAAAGMLAAGLAAALAGGRAMARSRRGGPAPQAAPQPMAANSAPPRPRPAPPS